MTFNWRHDGHEDMICLWEEILTGHDFITRRAGHGDSECWKFLEVSGKGIEGRHLSFLKERIFISSIFFYN